MRSDGTPQLYFAQQWGANCIYIQTDDRSYRDIRLAKPGNSGPIDDIGPRADNPNRTMLGATQLQWLKSTLEQAQRDGIPWKFVAISSPIDEVGKASATGKLSDGQPDRSQSPDGKSWWGGYRSERNQLLKFIADNHIEHVVFLTTDGLGQVRVWDWPAEQEKSWTALPADRPVLDLASSIVAASTTVTNRFMHVLLGSRP